MCLPGRVHRQVRGSPVRDESSCGLAVITPGPLCTDSRSRHWRRDRAFGPRVAHDRPSLRSPENFDKPCLPKCGGHSSKGEYVRICSGVGIHGYPSTIRAPFAARTSPQLAAISLLVPAAGAVSPQRNTPVTTPGPYPHASAPATAPTRDSCPEDRPHTTRPAARARRPAGLERPRR